ncbi:uncharacterized protein [Pyrus communis]|uniref:uncharacterized protein n=1 Tax=Pyrus communis TaxID=23211 RepID=UPI0035BFA4B5
MATGDAINRTNEQNTVDMKLSYKEIRSSTWNTSVSFKSGIKTTVETGVPLIAHGQIEVSAEFGPELQGGITKTSESEVETVCVVIVPPMTTVEVNLVATMGTCNVPFSYTQRDTFTNGEQITYSMDDGFYTGVNPYNFKYETIYKKACDDRSIL